MTATRGRLTIGRLPGYSHDLNPVGYNMWGHLKTNEIANLIATEACELRLEATATLRRMRRRRSIVTSCYTLAE